MSNSHLWKRLAVRVMTIFGSHVGPRIPNIRYMEVYDGKYGGLWGNMNIYEGIWRYMEYMEKYV